MTVIRHASLSFYASFSFQLPARMNGVLFQREPALLMRAQSNVAENNREYREYLRQAHLRVNQVSLALENITDPFEIDRVVLRLDYLTRTLANLGNLQTDEIFQQLVERGVGSFGFADLTIF